MEVKKEGLESVRGGEGLPCARVRTLLPQLPLESLKTATRREGEEKGFHRCCLEARDFLRSDNQKTNAAAKNGQRLARRARRLASLTCLLPLSRQTGAYDAESDIMEPLSKRFSATDRRLSEDFIFITPSVGFRAAAAAKLASP